MTDLQPGSGEATPAQAPTKAGSRNLALFWTKEFVAICFWVYVLCKLFVFDIDLYVIRHIDPQLVWIADYRFFLIIAVIAVALLLTKWTTFLRWALYILFYPIILVVWHLPWMAVKQRSWLFAFALINAVLSFFRSFKLKFVAAALFLISMLFALTFSNRVFLVVGIIGLALVLIISFVRMSLFVVYPSTIFQLFSKAIKKSPTIIVEHLADKDIRNLPVTALTDTQLELRRNAIQSLVILNRALLFFSHRLREYQESKLNAVSYSFNLLLLLALTVVAYGAINFALFKFDAAEFTVTTQPGYFLFLYYSFHVFLFGSIGEITPVLLYSQVVSMSEQILAIILLFILVALFISVRSEKYKEELDRTIAEANESQRQLDGLIQTTYNLTIDQALDEIQKMKSNMMKFIIWLSQDIPKE